MRWRTIWLGSVLLAGCAGGDALTLRREDQDGRLYHGTCGGMTGYFYVAGIEP